MITLTQVVVLLIGVVLLLGVALLWLVRRAKPVEPVYCIHCWVHQKKVTVVTHSEDDRRWAICQDCVGLYWDFQDEDSPVT